MFIVFLIFFYIFAIIGYIGCGLAAYVNLDDNGFDKLGEYLHRFLKHIFYKNNKQDCSWNKEHTVLFYKTQEYFESKIWKENYELVETIFDFICITFWPIWILINLIINAFYDD